MSSAKRIKIRFLKERDVDDALRLSTQAGWNQTRADWLRLLALWPKSCIGGWFNDRLIGTATLAIYSRSLAWVGMVLVDVNHRGRKFGTRMFAAITELGDIRKIETLALDATDQGAPLYKKLGYQPTGSVSRWVLESPTAASVESGIEVRPVELHDWPMLRKLDFAAAGVDRGPLISTTAAENDVESIVATSDGEAVGYVISRPGRVARMLGPMVARNPNVAQSLLTACLRNHDPSVPLIIDVPTDGLLTKCLKDSGFTIQRTLSRMTRPAVRQSPLSSESLCAGCGFEYG